MMEYFVKVKKSIIISFPSQGTFFGNIWCSWKSRIAIFYGLEGGTPVCTVL